MLGAAEQTAALPSQRQGLQTEQESCAETPSIAPGGTNDLDQSRRSPGQGITLSGWQLGTGPIMFYGTPARLEHTLRVPDWIKEPSALPTIVSSNAAPLTATILTTLPPESANTPHPLPARLTWEIVRLSPPDSPGNLGDRQEADALPFRVSIGARQMRGVSGSLVPSKHDFVLGSEETQIGHAAAPAQSQRSVGDEGASEWEWVQSNRQQLVEHYPGLWIAVVGNTVVAAAADELDVLNEAEVRGYSACFTYRVGNGREPAPVV